MPSFIYQRALQLRQTLQDMQATFNTYKIETHSKVRLVFRTTQQDLDLAWTRPSIKLGRGRKFHLITPQRSKKHFL
jgi:hypothetical protein